jgi:hypothetical protein
MKKWILRIVIGVLVLLVIAGVVGFFSLNTIVKKGVETVGPIVTKTDVKLTSATVSPFSGSGGLHGLVVGNPPGYKTDAAIKVGDIKVNVEARTLLSAVAVVDSIAIDAPEIMFEGSLTENNLKTILDNVKSLSGTDEKSGTTKPAEGGRKFRVKDLVIRRGKIHVTLNALKQTASASLPLPEIHITNIGNDSDGASTAELVEQVLGQILQSAVQEVSTKALTKELKNLGGKTGDQLEKSTERLKGLFKK